MQKILPLDGLRGCAVLSVLAYHSAAFAIPGGHFGVKVFYVLSGFLITSLILSEHARTGRLNLGQFYIRRALRLGPALLLTLGLIAVLLVVVPDLKDTIHIPLWLEFVSAIAYFNNWVSTFSVDSTGPLAHAWSLSVEEQFYLIWPPVFVLMVAKLSRAGLVKSIAWSIVGFAVFRAVVSLYIGGNEHTMWEFATPSSADSLLVGCLVAVILHHNPSAQIPRWVTNAAFGAVLISTFTVKAHTLFVACGFLTLFAVAAGLLVLGVTTDQDAPLARFLSIKPLTFVGRISYGLYLYHWPIFLTLKTIYPDQADPHNTLPFAAITLIGWALTFAVAIVSFFWVEAPILALKSRFTPPREAIVPTANRSTTAPSQSAP